MREILFRGKRIDNGEWVEGFLCKKYFPEAPNDRYVIQYKTVQDGKIWRPDYMVAEVDPETIGQYTGLTDKNGKKIFEGDIVREVWGERVFPNCLVVAMDPKRGGWFPFARGDGYGICEQDVWDEEQTEIIGNIHDNPELMK